MTRSDFPSNGTLPRGGTLRVLHVEAGGHFGGSLHALSVYLRHTSAQLVHDLLLYHETPGLDGLRSLVQRVEILGERLPASAEFRMTSASDLRRIVRRSRLGAALSDIHCWQQLAWSAGLVLRIRNFIQAGGYRLIHVNNTFPYQAPTLVAARRAGVPVVAHVRSSLPRSTFNLSMARLTHGVVTINYGLERELCAWGGGIRVATCLDGLELRACDPAAARALRCVLASPDSILIGSVGRLTGEKGNEVLIRAASEVVRVYPEAHFVVAGEGPLRPLLEELIAREGLTGRFQLAGHRTDIVEFLSSLDLFVCPSEREGGPYTLMEAMLLGKPVVSTAVGLAPDVIKPGVTGELALCGDSGALAAAINKALSRRVEMARASDSARRDVAAMMDPDASAARFDCIVEGALRS